MTPEPEATPPPTPGGTPQLRGSAQAMRSVATAITAMFEREFGEKS